MTVLQITPKPEPGESAGGCCAGGAVCGCSPEQLEDRGQVAAVGVGGELRTSSYIIYVDLPDNDSDMLIVAWLHRRVRQGVEEARDLPAG